MKRRRTGIKGYAHNSSLAISGSNNVQNARVNLTKYEELRAKNQRPLWPHHEHNHAHYRPSRAGEIAFVVRPDSSDPSFSYFEDSASKQLGTYDPEGDHIKYFTTMNSFGHSSSVPGTENEKMLQKLWRRRIAVIGLVVADVEPADNLKYLSNTVMVGKGKKTCANTGPKAINAGIDISADIPITADYDQKLYGITKIDDMEPNRMPLLTVPTEDSKTSVDTVKEYFFDDFRSHQHEKAVLGFYRGMIEAVMPLALHVIRDEITHYTTNNPALLAGVTDMASLLTFGFIKTAILGVDPDDHASLFSKLESLQRTNSVTGTGFNSSIYAPIYNAADSNSKLQNYVGSIVSYKHGSTGGMRSGPLGLVSVDPNTTDILASLLGQSMEYGIYDVISSVSDIIDISQRLKIGKSVTPGAPGDDFDIVLGI